MHKFSFLNRIIPLWNNLPDYVVSSPTLNTFKARLDRFWENQEVRYNWKADILYTGNRSGAVTEVHPRVRVRVGLGLGLVLGLGFPVPRVNFHDSANSSNVELMF